MVKLMAMQPFDPDLYAHLKALANRIHAERGRGQETMQPTALLHEAWMKLAASDGQYASKAHFVAVAARAMRQVLVDRARSKGAAKRGSGQHHTSLTGVGDTPGEPLDVLALDKALTELEAVDPRAAEVVLLRTFGGLTVEEVAAALGTSERTIKRSWRFSRAFLAKRLEEG